MKLETGEFLVRLARKTIENFTNGKPVERPKKFPECLKKKRGVFCTLNAYPSGELRGCIGVPYPTMPLIDAVIEAAKGSCRDPRFFPLQKEELDKITVEISVLTEPEDITTDPENYKDVIKIGRDGLIIYHPFGSGLLLPQVPVEHNWRVEEFLENLCYKAGLNPGCWRDPNTKIYRFEAEIFKELKPKGKVIKYA